MHLRHLDITNQNLSIWLSTYKITIPISYPKLNLKNMKGSIFVFFYALFSYFPILMILQLYPTSIYKKM